MIGQFTHITLSTGDSIVNTGNKVSPKVIDQIWPLVASIDFGGEAELIDGMMVKRLRVGFGADWVRCWQLRHKDHQYPCVQMMLCANVAFAKECWQAITKDNICAPGIKMPEGCFLAVAINPVPVSFLSEDMVWMLADMEQCIAWAWLKNQDDNDGKF